MCSRLLADHGIAVDYFRRDYDWYFLTHAHADHETGLKSKAVRRVHCSPETARVLAVKYPQAVPVPLEYGVRHELDNGNSVVAIPCDHCFGSCMFLFSLDGAYHLYTGDFRYSDQWFDRVEPFLRHKIDSLYVDTTFANRRRIPGWDVTIAQLNARRGQVVIVDPHLNTLPLWPSLKGGVYVHPDLRRHPFYVAGGAAMAKARSRNKFVVVKESTHGLRLTASYFACMDEYEETEDRICFSTHSDAEGIEELQRRLQPRHVYDCVVPDTDSCRL